MKLRSLGIVLAVGLAPGAFACGGGGGAGDDDTTGADTTGGPGPCEADADCDDDNACTVDRCNADAMCEATAVVSNECRPQIDVEFPPRGATLMGDGADPKVTITGKVTSAAGAIAALDLNGQAIAVGDDGSFSHEFVALVGGNTLDFNATDELGAERRRVQAFLWSSTYLKPTEAPTAMASEGLAFFLSQDSLDDGDHSLPIDDLATLLNVVLSEFDVGQFIDPNTPITNSAGYDVYLTDLELGSTDVSLAGIDGGLLMTATLEDIIGDLFFDCTTPACILAGGDGTGGLSVTTMGMTADVLLYVDQNAEVVVTVENVQTNLDTNDVDIWSDNIWTNFLISIIEPFIIDGVVQDISNELNSQVETKLGPALADALNGLKIDRTLELPNLADPNTPIAVQLMTAFSDTDFHDGDAPPDPSPPQGGAVVQSAGAYTAAQVTPYDNLGIPQRMGCGTGGPGITLTRLSRVEIGLSDDLLNQVLYGGWRGGLLEFPVTQELLGDTGGFDDLDMTATGLLAATASDCNQSGELLAHIGDLRFDATLSLLGMPVSFTAYTTMLVRIEVQVNGDVLDIGVTEIVDMKTELTVNEDLNIEAEPLIAASLESSLGDAILMMLGGGGLGSIALPEIDLGEQLGLPPDTAVLKITASGVHREPGTTVIEAHL